MERNIEKRIATAVQSALDHMATRVSNLLDLNTININATYDRNRDRVQARATGTIKVYGWYEDDG